METALETALAGARLSPADRRLCQELVFGVVRWRTTLDWLIARKTKSRAPTPQLQTLLRLGLYQIFWLERIPNHAAVHETVELARQRGVHSQAGFVNAVLRGYLREFDQTKALLAELKTSEPHLGYAHPEWLVRRWQKRWGAEPARRLMEWNNTPPKTFARVNTLKTTAAALLPQWQEEKVEAQTVQRDWLEENLVFELKRPPPLAGLASFERGWFYVQDPSTLLAVRELDPQPGETILDLCAAPGGKLTCIAQIMRNEGRLVGYDTSPDRLKQIQENCARLGVTCVELVLPQDSESGDPKSKKNSRPGLTAIELRVPRANGLLSPALYSNPDSVGTGIGEGEATTETRGASLISMGVPADPLPRGEGTAASALFHASTPLLVSPALSPGSRFDRVLIDAPCSNTGVMRRRVDLRWRIRPREIQRLRATQLALLRQAAAVLKPGGILVYSTCSLEAEENREVVQEFLAGQMHLKLQHERELLPFVDGVDGVYVARLTSAPVSRA